MRRIPLLTALFAAMGATACPGDDGGAGSTSATTGVAESSTSTTGDGTTTTGADSSSSGAEPVAYARCMDDNACEAMFNETCNTLNETCAAACEMDTDCPAPPSGDATPMCAPAFMECRLSCADNATCPEGMACEVATQTCFWNAS